MTPKEKALELREKCDGYTCYAEVVVDEIIKQFVGVYHSLKDAGFLDSTNVEDSANYKYWQEVKKEIEKL